MSPCYLKITKSSKDCGIMNRIRLLLLLKSLLFLLILSSNCNANLLNQAVETNDLPMATKLLNKGLDPNYTSYYREWKGVTPLGLACIMGYTKMAKLLIDHRAFIGTNLSLAIRFGPIEIVKLLLDCGADVNKSSEYEQSTLKEALLTGSIEKMRLLLERGAKVDGIHKDPDIRPRTAFCDAIVAGRMDLAQLLLEYGANINITWTVRSITPLHIAVNAGNVNAATFLLENKADVNAKDWLGDTPLHYAAKAGNEQMINLLLSYKADMSAKNKEGLSVFEILNKEARNAIEEEEAKERKALCSSELAAQLQTLKISISESAQRRAIIAEEQAAARTFSTSIPAYFRLLAGRFEQAYFFTSEIHSRDAHSTEEEEGLQEALKDEHHTKLVQRSLLGKRVFGTDTPICPICRDMCAYNQDVVTTKCGHMFHPGCFHDWYRSNRFCPYDRTPLAAKDCMQYRLAIPADSKPEEATDMPE